MNHLVSNCPEVSKWKKQTNKQPQTSIKRSGRLTKVLLLSHWTGYIKMFMKEPNSRFTSFSSVKSHIAEQSSQFCSPQVSLKPHYTSTCTCSFSCCCTTSTSPHQWWVYSAPRCYSWNQHQVGASLPLHPFWWEFILKHSFTMNYLLKAYCS